MKNKILGTMMVLAVSAPAFAADKGGLFVEPMVTYENGDGKIDYPNPFGNSDSDIKGWGVGTRLGFHIMDSIFVGADGRWSKPTFKDSSLDTKADAEAWNWGPTVGFQTPTDFGLRVWGTYIVQGELNPEKDNGVDPKFTQGSGYRVGAGVKVWMASLNVEWQKLTYDRSQASTNIANFSTNNADLKTDSWIFSVSFPIGL